MVDPLKRRLKILQEEDLNSICENTDSSYDLTTPERFPSSFDLSPDNRLLLTTEGNQVYLHDYSRGHKKDLLFEFQSTRK